jgi:hypothetical protein
VQTDDNKKPLLPSVHDAKPSEEGGAVARAGFNYQDEIAVSILLEMLESDDAEYVHCETHDDAVIIYCDGTVECVQVKSNNSTSLWTVANVTQRTGGKAGTSIYERSLARDAVLESMSFRLVTLRDVAPELRFLKFPLGKPGREPGHKNVVALCSSLDKKCPKAISPKGNGSSYWVDKCRWDVRESERSIADQNLLRAYQFSAKLGNPVLPEPLAGLLDELRKKVRDAGSAKWEPDREAKIFRRTSLLAWFKQRLADIESSTIGASGGKLQEKMSAAGLSRDLIRLAADMRRRYSEEVRAPRYMKADDIEPLQRHVRARVLTLQAKREADELGCIEDTKFHSMCVSSASQVCPQSDDQKEFLLGCMYDISDRCLLRFTRDKK